MNLLGRELSKQSNNIRSFNSKIDIVQTLIGSRLKISVIAFLTIGFIWFAVVQLEDALSGFGVLGPEMIWTSRLDAIRWAAVIITVFLNLFVVINKPFPGIKRFEQLAIANVWLSTLLSLFIGTGIVLFLFAIYGPYNYLFVSQGVRFLIGWIIFLLVFVLTKTIRKFVDVSCIIKIIFSASLTSLLFTIANSLSILSNNPLSVSWSEGSTLFFASSFHSKEFYDSAVGLPIINPGRALIQSFPFFIKTLPIVAHRFWDSALWIAIPLTVGTSFAKRLRINNSLTFLCTSLTSLLFLNLGPVYYHLLLIGLIVLAGFNSNRFWQSLFVVTLASLWAGWTRINWYPVAGSLAALLYMLEIPREKGILHYLWKPLFWFLWGSIVSFVSFRLYMSISGTPAEYFENPLTTPLLFYRLFPSATNSMGLIQSAMVAFFPGILLISAFLVFSTSINWFRRLAITGLLIVFFLGGMLVSIRIGGGNNLHNLDAFILLELVIMGYLIFNKVAFDTERAINIHKGWLVFLLCLVLLYPILKPLVSEPGMIKPINDADIKLFHDRIETDVIAGKSILLVDNPHLIALNFWQLPPTAPRFEKVMLMEAAITGNHIYLDNYFQALSRHQYDFILTEPLSTLIQGSTYAFGEENDVWVKFVAEPTLCYYREIDSFPSLGLVYLAPRAASCHANE